MRTSVRIDGVKKVSDALSRLDAQATKDVQDVINSTAQNIRNTAIRSIKNSPATGRVYKRGDGAHTASSEGNPPRTDGGGLARSIAVKMPQQGKALEAEVGAYIDYAAHLEYGTRNMGARPFMFPALEQNMKGFLSKMKQALQRGIARAKAK
jgi:HK97 gp10 family phage protein